MEQRASKSKQKPASHFIVRARARCPQTPPRPELSHSRTPSVRPRHRPPSPTTATMPPPHLLLAALSLAALALPVTHALGHSPSVSSPPLTAAFLPPTALLLHGSLPPSAGRVHLRLVAEGGGGVAEVRENTGRRGSGEKKAAQRVGFFVQPHLVFPSRSPPLPLPTPSSSPTVAAPASHGPSCMPVSALTHPGRPSPPSPPRLPRRPSASTCPCCLPLLLSSLRPWRRPSSGALS